MLQKVLKEKERAWWSYLVLSGALLTLPLSLSLLSLTFYLRFVVDEELQLVQGLNTAALPYFLAVTGTLNFLGSLLLLNTMARAHRPSSREDALRPLNVAIFIDLGITLLVFIACIVCFVEMSLLPSSFKEGLWKAMQQYRTVPSIKARVDLLQMDYACCGDSSYEDWFTVPWVPEDMLLVDPKELKKRLGKEGEYTNDDVPFSCCDPASPRPCIHHHVTTDYLHYLYDHRTNTTLYTTGCRHRLMDYFGHKLLWKVALSLLFLSVLQISLVTISRLLQTSMQGALDQGDVTAPAVGYAFILPTKKGVKTDVESGVAAEKQTLLEPGADKPTDTTDAEGETTTDDPGSEVSSTEREPTSTDLDTTPTTTDDEPVYENITPEEPLYENITPEELYENITPSEPLYDDIDEAGTSSASQQQQKKGAVPLFPSEMDESQSAYGGVIAATSSMMARRRRGGGGSRAFGSLGIASSHCHLVPHRQQQHHHMSHRSYHH